MSRDAADDLDDDEYRPREHGEKAQRRTPVAIVIILAVAAFVVLGGAALLVVRNRQAAEQVQRALAENQAETARALAEHERAAIVEKPRSNWDKVIGTWVREPGPKEVGGSPFRFVFREDHTAMRIRTNTDGQLEGSEGRIEVLSDQGDRLELRMKVFDEMVDYIFQVNPNATIVLTSGGSELVFKREK